MLAGGCFGLLAVSARLLRGFAPMTLLTDPAAWAGAAAGALGLILGALALQRASVVSVTSAMVATETVLGAVLGMIICADRPAAGLAVPAAAGFALVLAGALVLARFGAPEAGRGRARGAGGAAHRLSRQIRRRLNAPQGRTAARVDPAAFSRGGCSRLRSYRAAPASR